MLIRYTLDITKPRPTNPFPPQPAHCLYFYPYDKVICRNYSHQLIEVLPHSILVGPQLSRVDLTVGHNTLVILVCFRPGGMHRLLRIPMTEMLDRSFDSTLLLGKEIEQITEQLNESRGFDQMITIIQRYLLGKLSSLKNSLPIEQVLTGMLHAGTLVNVDHLAREACVSVRQLERQFKERIGMGPKLFSRVVRFSKAWIIREKYPEVPWVKIAHACEYADQMHMIRDFKDFADMTPGSLQEELEKSFLRLQGTTLD